MGFLQTVGQGYKIIGQEASQKIINNRANIFTGVSVLGTIATGIVSAFAGAKSARQIDVQSVQIGRPLTTKEKAALCWKNFVIPAGTVVVSSSGAIGSNRIMAGDIARLTTDVAMVTKGYTEFKKATKEVLNEKQQEQVLDKMADKERAKMDPKEINKLREPESSVRTQLFKESFTGISFFSTIDKVNLAVSQMREMMAELKPRSLEGFSSTELGVPLREFFSFVDQDDVVSRLYNGDVVIHEHFGFNKGFNRDLKGRSIDDDDPISIYLAPGETKYHGEPRSCYVIFWDKDPSDMRLGEMLKRNEFDAG